MLRRNQRHHPTLRRWLCALAVALCAIPIQASAQSPAAIGPVSLTYGVYAGGLRALDATVTLDLGQETYAVQAAAGTDGLIGRFASWNTFSAAIGTVGPDGGLSPRSYRTSGTWRGETRSSLLEFKGDGEIAFTSEPPRDDGRATSLTPDQLTGAVDPLSGIAALLAASTAAGRCDGEVLAYDGKRSFVMRFAGRGIRHLDGSRWSIYEGDAFKCHLEFEEVAGKWRDGQGGFWRREPDQEARPPIEVWLAALGDNGALLPVRMQSVTPMGNLIIHLQDVAFFPDATAAEMPSGG